MNMLYPSNECGIIYVISEVISLQLSNQYFFFIFNIIDLGILMYTIIIHDLPVLT